MTLMSSYANKESGIVYCFSRKECQQIQRITIIKICYMMSNCWWENFKNNTYYMLLCSRTIGRKCPWKSSYEVNLIIFYIIDFSKSCIYSSKVIKNHVFLAGGVIAGCRLLVEQYVFFASPIFYSILFFKFIIPVNDYRFFLFCFSNRWLLVWESINQMVSTVF